MGVPIRVGRQGRSGHLPPRLDGARAPSDHGKQTRLLNPIANPCGRQPVHPSASDRAIQERCAANLAGARRH